MYMSCGKRRTWSYLVSLRVSRSVMCSWTVAWTSMALEASAGARNDARLMGRILSSRFELSPQLLMLQNGILVSVKSTKFKFATISVKNTTTSGWLLSTSIFLKSSIMIHSSSGKTSKLLNCSTSEIYVYSASSAFQS